MYMCMCVCVCVCDKMQVSIIVYTTPKIQLIQKELHK